jgi:hypothetical protein
MIERLLVGLLLILCLVGQGKGEIQGLERQDVGKLVTLTATDDAQIFIWSIPDGVDFQAIEENRKVILTALEGSYKISLTTIKVNWETKQLTQSPQQSKVISFGKGLPPVPPVPPVPPTPDLKGLAKEVFDWASSVKEFRELGVKLSDNYLAVSLKYAASELTLEKAMDELRTLNGKVLDTREKKDAWAVFGSRLSERMTISWPMEKEKFVAFLNDVALGLNHVK